MGAAVSLTMAVKIKAVPTASAGGTPKKSVRTGAVITPPPTPIRPIRTAIANPRRNSMACSCLNVDSAFQFLARPSPGARIVGIERKRGARGAADTGVAAVIEGQQRDIVMFAVIPHIARGPVGERAHFAQRL